MIDWAQDVAILILLSTPFVQLGLDFLVYHRLRTRHRAVWEELGRPWLSFGLPLGRKNPFFTSGAYRRTGDAALERVVNVQTAAARAYLVGVIASFVVLFFL